MPEEIPHIPDSLFHMRTNEIESQDLQKENPLKPRLCMTYGQDAHQYSTQVIQAE